LYDFEKPMMNGFGAKTYSQALFGANGIYVHVHVNGVIKLNKLSVTETISPGLEEKIIIYLSSKIYFIIYKILSTDNLLNSDL